MRRLRRHPRLTAELSYAPEAHPLPLKGNYGAGGRRGVVAKRLIDATQSQETVGYIQMYHQLKQRNQATVFKIPNPDVYNENTKTMWNDWKNNTNIWFELFKDVVEIKL